MWCDVYTTVDIVKGIAVVVLDKVELFNVSVISTRKLLMKVDFAAFMQIHELMLSLTAIGWLQLNWIFFNTVQMVYTLHIVLGFLCDTFGSEQYLNVIYQ